MLKSSFKIPVSVLVVIHTAELDVLLIERADRQGLWQSVTGSLDTTDEALAQAAIREVGEETGIRVGGSTSTLNAVPLDALLDWEKQIQFEIFPQWRHRYAPGITHNTEHWFSLQVPRAIPVTLAPREHVALQWLPWQEAAQRCFSWSNREAIEALPQHLAHHRQQTVRR